MDSESTMSYGWIFIVLLLFFGIFGCGGNGGLFGARNCNAADAEFIALKAMNCSKNHSDNAQTDRDVLELKCNMTAQNAVLTQQLDTAFRTIITNQDAGFAGLRTSMLEDQIRARDMTLMAQNSEIMALKTQANTDARFNALERSIEAGFCQTLKRPPFWPVGCTPCGTGSCGCGNV